MNWCENGSRTFFLFPRIKCQWVGSRRVNTDVMTDETYIFFPTELCFQLSTSEYQDNLVGHLVKGLAKNSLLWSQRLTEGRCVRPYSANSRKPL